MFSLRSPDTDGDGLPDDWERNGVTIDGVKIDLPAMGADPMHKDLFVHADWMAPDPQRDTAIYKPYSSALKIVTDAFAVAPVTNPDLKPGIRLHVDAGSDSIMNPVTGDKWGNRSKAKEVPFQAELGSYISPDDYDWSGVDAIKALNYVPARRSAVFRYVLFCNSPGGSRRSGEARGTPETDFLVSLGKYPIPGGTEHAQAGTFMHELGHTLGLQHGGNDDINKKPNYLSVMNYAFQMEGIPRRPDGKRRRFDYSTAPLPNLDETMLTEVKGITGPTTLLTLWNKRTHLDEPPGANQCLEHPNTYFALLYPGSDWDCDGASSPNNVSADINGDGICVSPAPDGELHSSASGDDVIIDKRITAGPNRVCESVAACDPQDPNKCDVQEEVVGFVQPTLLPGFKDWDLTVLSFTGGGRIGKIASASRARRDPVNLLAVVSTAPREPTIEQILDAVPPALLQQELLAPHDVVTVSPQDGGAPLSVTFDGSASTAVSGTIVDWSWDFGDGTTGSGAISDPHL